MEGVGREDHNARFTEEDDEEVLRVLDETLRIVDLPSDHVREIYLQVPVVGDTNEPYLEYML